MKEKIDKLVTYLYSDNDDASLDVEAAQTLLELQSRLESLEKGAARYKGMRNLLYSQNIVIGEARLILKVTGCCPDEDEFDRGIDTAMQANKGE